MTIWICPFCKSELIFTLKSDSTNLVFNPEASFYACDCGKNIISEVFKNEDGTPKTFYRNKWKRLIDGRWLFLDESRRRNFWVTPKNVPENLKEVKMVVSFT